MYIDGNNVAEESDGKDLEANDSDNDTDSKGEGQEANESQKSDTITLTKAEREQLIADTRKDQDKRWKQRLKIGEGDDDGDDEEKGTTKEVDSERYDRLELKIEGITDKKEQDLVIEWARFKKISVSEAREAPHIKAAIKDMRDRSSTPAPSRRTNGAVATGDIDYWVTQYKKGRTAPTTEMRRKVRQALKQ